MVEQTEFYLNPRGRGFHLITKEIMEHLPQLPSTGILHLFIKHTSAALSINENADPDVRIDMQNIFDRLVRENEPFYVHTFEGCDDMPAHAKNVIVGSNLTIPISRFKLNMGTWQGIYLFEFRNNKQSRAIVATILQ